MGQAATCRDPALEICCRLEFWGDCLNRHNFYFWPCPPSAQQLSLESACRKTPRRSPCQESPDDTVATKCTHCGGSRSAARSSDPLLLWEACTIADGCSNNGSRGNQNEREGQQQVVPAAAPAAQSRRFAALGSRRFRCGSCIWMIRGFKTD